MSGISQAIELKVNRIGIRFFKNKNAFHVGKRSLYQRRISQIEKRTHSKLNWFLFIGKHLARYTHLTKNSGIHHCHEDEKKKMNSKFHRLEDEGDSEKNRLYALLNAYISAKPVSKAVWVTVMPCERSRN